ncbi:hypothetical protein DBR47_20870 [Paucibacter sp. KBW04]|uniref:hypothetical protein n=1 Tax=Paucibacter sp. KBW04 TaxID=2153361 RepID=UPI000F567B78|nr:hypothetical protein [Paucibacter sp. KBW04]RQO55329.1 hypothetical protein DBR47_20870 [Paucibacter sp. KBW04]
MSALHRVVPTLTEVVDEAVLEGREPRPAASSHVIPPREAEVEAEGLDLLDLSDLADPPELPVLPVSDALVLGEAPSPIAAQFLAQLPELSLDLPDLSLRMPADVKALEVDDFLADTRVPGQDEDGPATQAAALPADQELALGQAIDQAVDDALDEVLDQVLEKAVLALRAQLHGSVKAAVLRRLREQVGKPD